MSTSTFETTALAVNANEPGYDDLPPLYCRALYDYDAQDASAISFRKGDILEVLKQEPSGWWDGLLGDERGWFPSNYVSLISEEEAEEAFAEAEILVSPNHIESTVDMSQALGSTMLEGEDWEEAPVAPSHDVAQNVQGTGNFSNDFWEPQVTTSGQVFFVNTRTGERSRDLPQEADHEAPTDDLAALMSQPSSRSGTSSGLGLGLVGGLPTEASNQGSAGFGVPRRSGTPEPWVRKLADDGMSYYYYNKNTGTTQWTRPDGSASNETTNGYTSAGIGAEALMHRIRSESSAVPPQPNGTNRLSVYSDDSDVQPSDIFAPTEAQSVTETLVSDTTTSRQMESVNDVSNALQEITWAEKTAALVQNTLSPPPPETVEELGQSAFRAIHFALEKLSFSGANEHTLEFLVSEIVRTVRELLYVCVPVAGHNSNSASTSDVPSSHMPLRSSQRRVTATLSKLVLSARALEYEPDFGSSDTPARLKGDAQELDQVLRRFVGEASRILTDSDGIPSKRLYAVFSPSGVAPGLFGGGSGGDWLGFGWAATRRDFDVRILGPDVLTEVSLFLPVVETALSSLTSSPVDDFDLVQTRGEFAVSHLSEFLTYVTKIDVARHVDLDGVGQRASGHAYVALVQRARLLVRMLETVVQAVFDDNASLLMFIQQYRPPDMMARHVDLTTSSTELSKVVASLRANVVVIGQTLEALVTTGHDQLGLSPIDFSHSMDWRAGHLASLHSRHLSMTTVHGPEIDEGYVGMEDVFQRSNGKRRSVNLPQSGDTTDVPSTDDDPDLDSTDLDEGSLDGADLEDDDLFTGGRPRAGTKSKGKKILEMMGTDIPAHILKKMEPGPWYLTSTHGDDIQIETDGSVRGGTVNALVEHLTTHDATNPAYAKAFMMSFKSFMTIDELFDLLVQRFHIQPPSKLTDDEYKDWAKNKQYIVRMRVLNAFKTMVTDDDVLEKEDAHIYDRIREFITSEEVARLPAAKQLAMLLERGRARKVTALTVPPPPILPKSLKKLKLLEIDPLELARQLTIMESDLFMRIRTMECFQRSREQKTAHGDNIATVIQTSNKIADWVAFQILERDDSRKRAAVLKQFISIADRCRILHNFSTMVAITSGLNTPPIRRLKRTWEHIPPKLMSHFNACEAVMESTKNYNSYRQAMSTVNPPCVPFIGVFLTTLQFIHDGSKDMLAEGVINFRKRQKASEVIQDIKRWQAAPFHFTPVPQMIAYLHESLDMFNAGEDVRERFWNLSLEREPREREDERMARLLQESGFL